ncbi:MAG: hypothetical protein GXO00_01775 [Candidatus Diapherotrites archaeon]|nr:hypothetical protein [Candidatus Diapherotrites archaeon]
MPPFTLYLEAALLGHFYGDGQRKRYGFVYWTSSENLRDRVYSLGKAVLGFGHIYRKKNLYVVSFERVSASRWLESWEASKYKLSRKVLDQDKKFKANFLYSLFLDDGNLYKNEKRRDIKWRLYSKSKTFLEEIGQFIEEFGFNGRVLGPYKTGYGNKLYELRVGGREALRLNNFLEANSVI